MIKIFRLLLAAIGIIIVAAFAVANRTPVDVSFWPYPLTVDMPLYGVLLVGVFIGVVLGGTAVWLGSHKKRAAGAKAQRQVRAAEAQARREEAKAERDAIKQSRQRREALALEAPSNA